jgi:hypothetical protein
MAVRRFALLAVALIAALPPTAALAGSSYTTTVVVSLKFPAFHGTLKSGRSACATDRTVKLFREKSGPDKLLGADTSNSKAEWSIPIGKRLTSGTYYAKATAKGRCKPAKSKTIPIG